MANITVGKNFKNILTAGIQLWHALNISLIENIPTH